MGSQLDNALSEYFAQAIKAAEAAEAACMLTGNGTPPPETARIEYSDGREVQFPDPDSEVRCGGRVFQSYSELTAYAEQRQGKN